MQSDLLNEALEVMGVKRIGKFGKQYVFDYVQRFEILDGTLSSEDANKYRLNEVKAQIKQSVSRVVVNRAAKRLGWMVQEKSPNKLTVKRRY
jgi:predicted P-loop ATPase/GTPase